MSKPELDLEMIGVPLGAQVTFHDDDDTTCIVTQLSPPEVVYKGKVYTLYEATMLAFGSGETFWNGSSLYWRMGGETLHERRQRYAAYHRKE